MSKNYIIAGYTGLTGREIVRQIIQSDEKARIVCLGRSKPVAMSAQITHVEYQFDQTALKVSNLDGGIFVCALGTTIKKAGSQANFRRIDFDFCLNFAQLAKTCNAESFHLVTALGADPKSSIFYNRVKGEIEAAIAKLNLKVTNFYHPSLLVGDRAEARTAEKVAIGATRFLAPIFDLPFLKKIKPTPVDRLAAYILNQAEKTTVGVHTYENEEILARVVVSGAKA